MAAHDPTPANGRAGEQLTIADLRGDRRLFGILLEHGLLGARVQAALRLVLVAFVGVTVLAVPPARDRTACQVTVALYAVGAVAIAWRSRRGGERALRLVWLALLVDLVVLGVLSVLAGRSEQSWTADVLVNGFYMIPLLASTQLRPWVAVAVTVPAVAIYLASLIAAQHANAYPSVSIALWTGVLAALSVASVALSWIGRSRVLTIAGLADDRTQLLAELVDVETRARGALAEELHDGALQYLLGARQELDGVRAGDAEALRRVDLALRESAALLRAKVSQLHPAVLEQAGLLRALQDLVRVTAERSGVAIRLDADGWEAAARSPSDGVAYAAARELLTNVAKHARARTATVSLRRVGDRIVLTVADDGAGIEPGVAERRLAEGHIGVGSQRIRIEAAGGSFRLAPGDPGTVAEVRLPA